MKAIRPLMSHRYHVPPSAHTTFVAPRFVVCTFAPRPFESDPGAIKVPFFHSNDDYDEVIAIPEARAFQLARQAAREEGIFSGPSTGANLAAALDIARRFGPGHRVVTVQVDSGLKYLTGPLYS